MPVSAGYGGAGSQSDAAENLQERIRRYASDLDTDTESMYRAVGRTRSAKKLQNVRDNLFDRVPDFPYDPRGGSPLNSFYDKMSVLCGQRESAAGRHLAYLFSMGASATAFGKLYGSDKKGTQAAQASGAVAFHLLCHKLDKVNRLPHFKFD